ncbi:GntR family transcriptional regulator [Cloacibacillus evryensis]
MNAGYQTMGCTAVDCIYSGIRKKIISKELQKGQRLAETVIAKEFNVSRTPVREAIRRLANDGLVNIVPGWGAHLVSPTKEEVIDTSMMRQVLEEIAIRKAVQAVTPVYIYKLQEQILLEQKAAAECDVDAYIAANNNFHLVIAEASGSKTLFELLEHVLAKVVTHLLFFDDSLFKFDTNPALNQHKEIVRALESGDVDLCVKLIKQDIYPWSSEL